ncbi:hypothetical protein QBC39DRAFT_362841 [Podospora conica]|nr:hypothetical protein QBC39DRAFT_362841 [Schizothecium conicum]
MGAFLFLLCVSLHITTTIPHGIRRVGRPGSARVEVDDWFLVFNCTALGSCGNWEREKNGMGWAELGSPTPLTCGSRDGWISGVFF